MKFDGGALLLGVASQAPFGGFTTRMLERIVAIQFDALHTDHKNIERTEQNLMLAVVPQPALFKPIKVAHTRRTYCTTGLAPNIVTQSWRANVGPVVEQKPN